MNNLCIVLVISNNDCHKIIIFVINYFYVNSNMKALMKLYEN